MTPPLGMTPRPVVVWGNCQAPPIADLLTAPLARHGLRIDPRPAVYLITAAEAEELRAELPGAGFLLSQPIRDDYRIPGLGMHQLGALLPPTGRVITFPVTFHTGPFPYQVNAHGGDGERVDAPLTDYHDLRAVVAAARGLGVADGLAWWPAPAAESVRAIDAESIAELHRREAGLDVASSDLAIGPGALMTITHPSNGLLGAVAQRLLAAMGIDGAVHVPDRLYLGERQAPIEPAVAAALGWASDAARADWAIGGRTVPLGEILGEHLDFYRARPDVVADTLKRYSHRLSTLRLTP